MTNIINALKVFFILLLIISARSSVYAQNATPNVANKVASEGQAANSFSTRDARYLVHASDSLELSFPLTPDFNQTVTVRPDGYITLRNVGEMKAAGQTLSQLTESVKAAYSKILHDPVVSIDTKDFVKPYFVVGGQVGRPGKFEWREDITLSEAIAIAGGFTDAAKHSQVLMFRRISNEWTQAKIIDLKKMLNARNLQEDPVLEPGDMLFVPKNALSKIKPFLPTASAGAFYNPANF